MKLRSGINLLSLVITIIILVILAGTVILLNKTNIILMAERATLTNQIIHIEENLIIYINRCKVKDVLFNEKNLNWNGVDAVQNTGKLQNGVDEDEPLYIFGDNAKLLLDRISIVEGKLVFNTDNDMHKKWVSELGILTVYTNKEVAEQEISLKMPTQSEQEYNGLKVSIDNNGIITLNGKLKINAAFFKVTDEIVAGEVSTAIYSEKSKLATKFDNLKLEVEHISGSIENIDETTRYDEYDNPQEFNVALRTKSKNEPTIGKVFLKTELLKNNYIDPSEGYSASTNDVVFSYIYVKGNMEFKDYKLKIKLLKKEEQIEEIVGNDNSNTCNMKTGVVLNTGGVNIEVLPDYTIKLTGKSTIDKLYVLLLSDKLVGVSKSSNNITAELNNPKTIIKKGTKINFKVLENNSSRLYVPTGGQFNVLLRGFDGTSSSVISYDNNAKNQFSCMMGSNGNSKEIIGTVTSENVKLLGLYITSNCEFRDYIIKPIITVVK